MLIDWMLELQLGVKLILSFLVGGFIGWEREKNGQEAGIRTFGLISVGSCAFGLISIYSGAPDITRVSAQIISGVGFICGGVIFREQGGVLTGITTAATLWCSAACGLAIAYDMYVISIMNCLIMLCFLSIKNTKFWKFIAPKKRKGSNDSV
ncbi:MAG: MgtC/SapB family protein [Alphaproteobacteria bacterium]|nr:MgtC/SapB family protein [Alphaproteobacteria bacterium]